MVSPTLDQRLALREEPMGPHVMEQKWRQLLFLHWSFSSAVLQATLPPGLSVDTFNGKAYVGLVPFFMRDIRPRRLPAVPGISNFLETNVRTYVVGPDGTPGVWFYSLDASGWVAVEVARRLFHLPYFHARMDAEVTGDRVRHETRRRGLPIGQASRFEYKPVAPAHLAEPGSLEFFLLERYALFARKGERIGSGRVHHVPYPVQPARVAAWDARLLVLAGLPAPDREPDHVAMSPGVDVRVFPLRWL